VDVAIGRCSARVSAKLLGSSLSQILYGLRIRKTGPRRFTMKTGANEGADRTITWHPWKRNRLMIIGRHSSSLAKVAIAIAGMTEDIFG
jgi:hypothetical protein